MSARGSVRQDQYICKPGGDCEACPSNALTDSACGATGNRRPIHCITMSLYESLGHDNFTYSSQEGQLAAWEPCGKIVSVESADYWEFVLCNLAFSVVGLFIVFTRTRRTAAVHYKNLVARIRGGVRVGWSNRP
ncbi:uncharacterized protein EI90DRAFT_2923963 [Cantharellus anzutake]|uniref:uncharacterized protein n=1 Tax=Cantharellus anzutake TaxID=1750568 RepID=UPI001908B782|nr:uncharacterized protein EI90DRAFT_2923963 [Cantharellus anzutake]KAF8329559.1 hypothetical protein EI90DRAFT_2923963 [Cantharellus anzutake]